MDLVDPPPSLRTADALDSGFRVCQRYSAPLPLPCCAPLPGNGALLDPAHLASGIIAYVVIEVKQTYPSRQPVQSIARLPDQPLAGDGDEVPPLLFGGPIRVWYNAQSNVEPFRKGHTCLAGTANWPRPKI
jgi:hypothetical protein